LFPLFWPLLEPAGAIEIVAHRSLWTLVFVALLISVTGAWKFVRIALSTPRTRWLLLASAVLITLNWTGYIWAVLSDKVLEASLGYFINPLVSVLIGVALSERLRRAQWVAVALGGVAVAVLTVAYGRPPWVALLLASTFALYGLIRKLADVPTTVGLTVESLFLLPVSATIVVLGLLDSTAGFGDSLGNSALFALSGVVTALPLLAFGAAATRLPLSSLGLLQYLTPIMQFLLGYLVFNEQLSLTGWVGFTLIWFALLIFTTDALRHNRATPAPTPTPANPA
jgi:chloramphenicol-sensitive protein RarD